MADSSGEDCPGTSSLTKVQGTEKPVCNGMFQQIYRKIR